jgi:hypothetical protein
MSSYQVTIKPGQLGAFITGSAKGQQAAIERGVRIAKHRAKALLQLRTPVDMGVMRAAWTVTKGGVENSFPLAGVIERGARPHKVSREGREAIYEWVKRKVTLFEGRIGPHRPGRGKKNHYGRMLTVNDVAAIGEDFDWLAREVAGAIVARIERDGYKGTYFIEESMPDITAILMEEVNRSVQRALLKGSDSGGE